MNEQLTLKCAFCDIRISQQDADESDEIFPDSGLTLCQECARTLPHVDPDEGGHR